MSLLSRLVSLNFGCNSTLHIYSASVARYARAWACPKSTEMASKTAGSNISQLKSKRYERGIFIGKGQMGQCYELLDTDTQGQAVCTRIILIPSKASHVDFICIRIFELLFFSIS